MIPREKPPGFVALRRCEQGDKDEGGQNDRSEQFFHVPPFRTGLLEMKAAFYAGLYR